jgi:CelD/BcsL family acetyltransferase involved in cellulose biosynthesis
VPLRASGGGYEALGNYKIADYGPVAAAPGSEERVAAATFEWLERRGAGELRLWGMVAGSTLERAFAAAAATSGWAVQEEAEAVCPRAELMGGWEAYLGRLSKHDRHELRRKLRNFEARGKVAFEVETEPAAVAAKMDVLFEMMRASHDRKAGFLTPQMEAFFRDVGATFAGLGIARLCTLTLDGDPAAMLLAFENETDVFLYNSGYAPALAAFAPGLVSKALALRDAIERGKTTFDFLRGEEEYKFRLGGQARQLVRMTMRREGRG